MVSEVLLPAASRAVAVTEITPSASAASVPLTGVADPRSSDHAPPPAGTTV